MGNYTLGDYHGRYPAWRCSFDKSGGYIGIELECVSNTRSYQTLLNAMPDFSFGRSPLSEEDGSLPENGVEFIFPPVSYTQIKKTSSVVFKALESLKGKTNSPRGYNVGMHMNVNTRGWSSEKINIFVATVHNISQAALERIGGRRLNNYCSRLPGELLEEYRYLDDHAYAAESKGSRIELRFPGTTTDHNRVVQLTEFIEMLDRFSGKLDGKLPIGEVTTSREMCSCGNPNCYENTIDRDVYDDDFDTTLLEGMFKKYCSKTIKGRRVLGYLYNDQAASKDSTTTAEPALAVSTSTTGLPLPDVAIAA